MTTPRYKSSGVLGALRNRPRIYRAARSVISPLLPGRGAGKLLRRLPQGSLILNIGSGPLIYRPDIINVDPYPVPGVRVQGDAEDLPFAGGSVDGAISEVTLEHVPDPAKAVSEMIRCLRPGGLLYISVPFLQPYHAAPRDFGRWTLPGLRRLVGDLRVIETGVAGGPTAAVTWILSEYVAILLSFGSSWLQANLSRLLRTIASPLKVIDLLLVRLPSAPIIASLLYVVAEKEGGPEPDREQTTWE